MTTEEKLQHFLQYCMEDARTRSAKMLDDYTAALEQTFQEHTAHSTHNAAMRLEMESAKIEREINKQLSIEQINIKRMLGQKQDELKDTLFSELQDMLANFMSTSEYEAMLERQIQKAKDFAGDKEMVIYMDPADEQKSRLLAMNHNVNIKISEYSFLGGTRVVIPELNVLIDNSFRAKLDEAKHDYRFELSLGGTING